MDASHQLPAAAAFCPGGRGTKEATHSSLVSLITKISLKILVMLQRATQASYQIWRLCGRSRWHN
jgi:hypothetical protein